MLAAVVLFLCVGGVAWLTTDEQGQKHTGRPRSQDKKQVPSEKPIRIGDGSVMVLWNLYAEKPVEANATCTGKLIDVKGRTTGVFKAPDGRPYLAFSTYDNPLNAAVAEGPTTVYAYVSDRSRHEASKVFLRQEVRFVGRCKGSRFDRSVLSGTVVTFEDCELVP
jgi:hypothetical protein